MPLVKDLLSITINSQSIKVFELGKLSQ